MMLNVSMFDKVEKRDSKKTEQKNKYKAYPEKGQTTTKTKTIIKKQLNEKQSFCLLSSPTLPYLIIGGGVIGKMLIPPLK